MPEGGGYFKHPLGTPSLKTHFPLRNRIISGLAKWSARPGTSKSGAVITAGYAETQGELSRDTGKPSR